MIKSGLKVDIKEMGYPRSDGKEGVLIQDFFLRALPHTFVSFIGRSGAGKTTLLRMVAGFEARFEGQITVDEVPVRPSSTVQMVFQDSRLLPWKTVSENVAFSTKDPDGQGTRLEVAEWLKRFGLDSKVDEWPKNLSGGEATRVAIARALVVHPSILLLDEPFQSLDLITRYEVQEELLRALDSARPVVLLVSHSIDDAVFLSDEIHVLTTRPMKIGRTFRVPVARPRYRGQPELSQIAAEIGHYLGEMSSKTHHPFDLQRRRYVYE